MGVVLAPANGKGAALRLIEAGAREIYFGFHDENWTWCFGNADINRMSGFGTQANVLTFEQLLDEIVAVREVYDASQVSLFCTFNSALYTTEQADFIAENYLEMLANAGLTGIIVSGPRLIQAAHGLSLTTVASTMCSVYNEDIARYYRDCGIKRAILPRDLTLAEINAIVHAVPELEYEAFLMRNGCVFADSHCLGLHRADCPSLCRTLRESAWWEIPFAEGTRGAQGAEGAQDAAEQEAAEQDAHTRKTRETYLDRRIETGRQHKDVFHINTCGLCALWRLEQTGITAYKVVGRSDRLEDLCRDVALTCENLAIAQKCDSESAYLERMTRPENILALCANQGLSCYYPECRFD